MFNNRRKTNYVRVINDVKDIISTKQWTNNITFGKCHHTTTYPS